MISIRDNVQQRVATKVPPSVLLLPSVTATTQEPESVAQPNFATLLSGTDTAVRGLIGKATNASTDERRACAQIAVEGVRLYLASESIPDWAELAQHALAKNDIKVNKGDNFHFRLVANLLFRGITKVRDDAEWTDSKIGHTQISRYGQAMAWTYATVKAGTDIETVADQIVALGGVRKVADLWSGSQSPQRESAAASDTTSVAEERPSNLNSPQAGDSLIADDQPALVASVAALATHSGLRFIGKVTLDQPLDTPTVCIIYPDGRLAKAPLPAASMAAMVSQWEAGQ